MPSRMPHDSVIWILAAIAWYSAVLYGGRPYNYKLGPRANGDQNPMSSQETYQRFARYYDLYVGDFNADLPLYRSLCTPAHHVLEIGCGTGRVLRAVLAEGC